MIKRNFKKLVIFSFISTSYAAEIDFSGYLNLAYNISDKSYIYDDFISNRGTFRRNTNFGLQADTKLNDEFSISAQTKYSQSLKDEKDFDLILNWGFLNYRPLNDLSISIGKIRVPFYLNSQNEDVGVTYDFTKLPEEVYTLSPYDNGLGAIISKSFELNNGYLNLDLFHYRMDLDGRSYIPNSGAFYFSYNLDVNGLSFDYTSDNSNKYRIGYYKTDLLNYDIEIITAGVFYNINDDYTTVNELIYSNSKFLNNNYESKAGYISLFRNFDEITVYSKYGTNIPSDTTRGFKSYSIGGNYSIESNKKIKFEYNHIKTKSNPQNLIDFENGKTYSNENINLFTISYNLAF